VKSLRYALRETMKPREILLFAVTAVAIFLAVDGYREAERQRRLRRSPPVEPPKPRIVHIANWLWKKE
jgi:hypothetical protein